MALRDQPYLPLYVQDYLTDEKLNACSAATQGIYIKIMCVLHKSEQYGTILLKQKDKQNPSNIKNFAYKIAKLLPFTEEEIENALSELIDEGVMTLSEDTLFQKRMVKDNKISEIRSSAGSKGAEARLQNDDLLKQKSSKSQAKGQAKSKQNTEYENEYENDIDTSLKDKVSKKDIDTFFEQLWKLYPKKEGKGQVGDAQKKKLYAIGLEEMIRAIGRYEKAKSGKDRQYLQNGSTFFNSGYVDYLDANYHPEQDRPKKTSRANILDEIIREGLEDEQNRNSQDYEVNPIPIPRILPRRE